MHRDTAIATLKAHEAALKQLGVQHLYLFGSTARDDARDDSDVDLFFDYEKGKLSLFGLMEVKDQAARIPGRKTDIMARNSIHKVLLARIEASALQVFRQARYRRDQPGTITIEGVEVDTMLNTNRSHEPGLIAMLVGDMVSFKPGTTVSV
jgi:predicted nucleotidyltransferase